MDVETYVLNRLQEKREFMKKQNYHPSYMDGYLQAIAEAKDLILVDCIMQGKHKEEDDE